MSSDTARATCATQQQHNATRTRGKRVGRNFFLTPRRVFCRPYCERAVTRADRRRRTERKKTRVVDIRIAAFRVRS